MARKKKHEEHENHERWLVSYADFITLLFAFFVVMYSVSSVNEGKYRVLSDALVAAFRSPAKSMLPIQYGEAAKSPAGVQFSVKRSPAIIKTFSRPLPMPHGMDDQKEKEANLNRLRKEQQQLKAQTQTQTANQAAAAIQKMADDIEKAMSSLIKDNLIKVRRSTFWLEVEINTSILYPSGSARLESGAVPVLEGLVKALLPFPNAIHVEGFTDNVPISTPVFPSNWELSSARAASVVQLFARLGILPTRLAAIGYGEHRPVADNVTAEGRAKNRRVVIVVLSGADSREVFGGQPQQLDAKLSAPPEMPAQAVAPELSAPPAVPVDTAPVPEVVPAAPAKPRLPGEPLDVTDQETTVRKFEVIHLPVSLPFPGRPALPLPFPPRVAPAIPPPPEQE